MTIHWKSLGVFLAVLLSVGYVCFHAGLLIGKDKADLSHSSAQEGALNALNALHQEDVQSAIYILQVQLGINALFLPEEGGALRSTANNMVKRSLHKTYCYLKQHELVISERTGRILRERIAQKLASQPVCTPIGS